MYRKNNPKAKKAKGAASGIGGVVGVAKRFARSNGFKVIAPATLQRSGKTAQLDALVIGYFGVLGVKAYGYNGEIYGNATEENWLQVAGNGKRTPFKNPLQQAAADVRVIRDALFESKMKTIPVEVVCVFADPKAQIAVPGGAGYYTAKTFKQLLGKEKYLADKGLDLEKAEQALRAALAE